MDRHWGENPKVLVVLIPLGVELFVEINFPFTMK